MNRYYFDIRIPTLGKKPLGETARYLDKTGDIYRWHGDWLEAESKESVRQQVQYNWPNCVVEKIRTESELEEA